MIVRGDLQGEWMSNLLDHSGHPCHAPTPWHLAARAAERATVIRGTARGVPWPPVPVARPPDDVSESGRSPMIDR